MLPTIYADVDVGIGALFGRPSAALEQRMQRDVQSFVQRTSGVASNIASRVQESYHDFTQGEFARKINAIRNTFTHAWKSDGYRSLTTIDEVQHASASMRRYVMAQPELRGLYKQNRIEGYGDDYIDASPTGVGKTHFDYRVATNSVLVEKKVDNKTHLVLTQYVEKAQPEYQLTIQNKAAIDITHKTVAHLLKNGLLDPTSESNALLG